ncbi:uncharacterized protein LAESUDRAFT_615946, partial [Laetiporus sulphureus 93-53]
IEVRKNEHSLSSFENLTFLIPTNRQEGEPLLKVLVFFDNIEESIKARDVLRVKLLPRECEKIKWFNSRMLEQFRDDTLHEFVANELYGMYATDSFSMV